MLHISGVFFAALMVLNFCVIILLVRHILKNTDFDADKKNK